MQPLTMNDLLPLEEYASRRREFFDSHRRYVERYRRVRIGPRLTLIFENRQTLWYRLQEIIRIARLVQPEEVQQELNLYNRLLPCQNLLQAALLIDIPDPANFTQEMETWNNIQGSHLRLESPAGAIASDLVTCRPEDRCIGTAHWVQFQVEPRVRRLLADRNQPSHFHFDNGRYQHRSAPLSEDLRLSLVEDLVISDRDPERRAS